MRYLYSLIALIAFYTPTQAQQAGIAVIGPGCTTTFYIDKACKPCGVGMKSSGVYPVNPNPPGGGSAPFYTLGDSPDAEPNDPTVCTAAQWQTKWGWNSSETSAACSGGTSPNNGVMQTYLNQDFIYGNHQIGFTNNTNIYYLSQTGNNATALPGCPEAPYATWAPIATALSTTTNNFSGQVSLTSGSPIITVTSATSGTLGRGSHVVATGIPVNTFIRQQLTINGGVTPGVAGTYLMNANATSTVGPETLTGSIYPGGVAVIRGGMWSGCTGNPPTNSPCLSFQAQAVNGGNPSWFPSASPSGWLLITSYPGEAVQIISGSNSGDIFDFGLSGVGNPGRAGCCVIINGLMMSDPKFGNGSQGAIFSNFMTDLIIQYNEIVGFDKTAFANGSRNVLIINNVFHEIFSHAVYEDWNTGCAQSNPGVDTDFSRDLTLILAACGASFNNTLAYNVVYDSGRQNSDIFHINGWTDAGWETDNIVSYSGYPFALMEGNYNNHAVGNLLFDNSSQCFLDYTFANFYSIATFSSGSTSLAVTTIPTLPGAGPNFGAAGYFLFGNGIPQSQVPNGTKIVTAAPSNQSGTYTISAATTASANSAVPLIAGGNNGASNNPGPSTERYNSFSNNVCWMGNPSDSIFGGSPGMGIFVYDKTGVSYHKNETFNNNVIVTYDTVSAAGSVPIQFEVGSAQSGGVYSQPTNAGVYPETDTITGNQFYNIGNFVCSQGGGDCRIATADPGSSQNPPWFAGGTFTATTFGAQFSGNTYLGSLASNPSNNPLPGAIEANAQSPGLFTFPIQYMVK